MFHLQRYPVIWQGMLALKNDDASVQIHHVSGDCQLARVALPKSLDKETGLAMLRIERRMRLQPQQLEGIATRMTVR